MITITPVTPEQVATLVASLRANATTVDASPAGTFRIAGHGVTAAASFDGETLTVDVITKTGIARFASEGHIEAELRKQLTA